MQWKPILSWNDIFYRLCVHLNHDLILEGIKFLQKTKETRFKRSREL